MGCKRRNSSTNYSLANSLKGGLSECSLGVTNRSDVSLSLFGFQALLWLVTMQYFKNNFTCFHWSCKHECQTETDETTIFWHVIIGLSHGPVEPVDFCIFLRLCVCVCPVLVPNSLMFCDVQSWLPSLASFSLWHLILDPLWQQVPNHSGEITTECRCVRLPPCEFKQRTLSSI